MSYTILEALVQKASIRADDLQARGNNHVRIAALLKEEGFEAAAEQVEVLGEMYKRLAADLRTCIRGMAVGEKT